MVDCLCLWIFYTESVYSCQACVCVCVCVRVSVSATGELRSSSVCHALRTVLMIALGMCSQYWLLVHVSGFQSPYTTLLCMLLCRAMSSIPYIHVNIFQVSCLDTLWQYTVHTSTRAADRNIHTIASHTGQADKAALAGVPLLMAFRCLLLGTDALLQSGIVFLTASSRSFRSSQPVNTSCRKG